MSKKTIILDLTNVYGAARTVISTEAQNKLFQMGVEWNSGKKTPLFTSAEYLILGGETGTQNKLTYAYNVVHGEVTSYPAESKLQEFLDEAQRLVFRVETVIQGVKVVITKDGIFLDTKELLESVMTEAQAQRARLLAE